MGCAVAMASEHPWALTTGVPERRRGFSRAMLGREPIVVAQVRACGHVVRLQSGHEHGAWGQSACSLWATRVPRVAPGWP